MIITVNISIQAIAKKKPEKIRTSTGFKLVTSATSGVKLHIGRKVNLLSSYLPMGSEMM